MIFTFDLTPFIFIFFRCFRRIYIIVMRILKLKHTEKPLVELDVGYLLNIWSVFGSDDVYVFLLLISNNKYKYWKSSAIWIFPDELWDWTNNAKTRLIIFVFAFNNAGIRVLCGLLQRVIQCVIEMRRGKKYVLLNYFPNFFFFCKTPTHYRPRSGVLMRVTQKLMMEGFWCNPPPPDHCQLRAYVAGVNSR